MKNNVILTTFKKIYPICFSFFTPTAYTSIIKEIQDLPPETFPKILGQNIEQLNLPIFLPQLAIFEWTKYYVSDLHITNRKDIDELTLNPTLELLPFSFTISSIIKGFYEKKELKNPEHNEEWIMIWKCPVSKQVFFEKAMPDQLLILKMISENIAVYELIENHDITLEKINKIINQANKKGFIFKPTSKIKRKTNPFSKNINNNSPLIAKTFTLQWHITHACDLSCKHCYDRSNRKELSYTQSKKVIDDFYKFCSQKYVQGHICFSGGNPFLYKDFLEIYKYAADKEFSISLLANPIKEDMLKEFIEIQMPGYYQVSLEGLKQNNDNIRGAGNFDNVINFLNILKKNNVSSAVMLTLTKENMNEIIPLANFLQDKSEYFTFNRLTQVGEGAQLSLPLKEDYELFLKQYIKASETNSIMGFKDNLINITLHNNNDNLFNGCTGFGCGAAFNFVTLLPDGEIHACRKFPSLIDNILTNTFANIYDSELAVQYRNGAEDCNDCDIRNICGGCMAIAYSHGLDIFKEKDPYCFMCKETVTN